MNIRGHDALAVFDFVLDFNLCTDKNGNFHPTEDMPLLAGRYKFTQVIGVGQSSIVLKAKVINF